MSTKREEQLTEIAKRMNLTLIKSKAKRRSENDHKQYRIVDVSNIVLAGKKFDMSLDDVEKFLKDFEVKSQTNIQLVNFRF